MSTGNNEEPANTEKDIPDSIRPLSASADAVDFYKSHLFRWITLLLYVSTVSAIGLTLALYYFFIWDSAMPPIPQYKATVPNPVAPQLH